MPINLSLFSPDSMYQHVTGGMEYINTEYSTVDSIYTPVSPVMDQLVPHTGKNILKVPALAVNTIFLGIFFVAVPCSFWFCCL